MMGSVCTSICPPPSIANHHYHRHLPIWRGRRATSPRLRRRRHHPPPRAGAVADRSLRLPPRPPPSRELQPEAPADPDLLRICTTPGFNTFGVNFLEGPDGIGVYATREIQPKRSPLVVMEIPINLMLTVTSKPPFLFFPDHIPMAHPIFDIINSTDPLDWDLRLASLLLYAIDCPGNFWHLYSDFIPDSHSCTSLLLATDDDLRELQDPELAARAADDRARALQFWREHWREDVVWKIRRLAKEPERFLWAVGIAQTRCFVDQPARIRSFLHNRVTMLAPYADMFNHSVNPNCFLHWRYRDRTLEVLVKAGHKVKEGDEMTINYFKGGANNNILMERYGFSSITNPWGYTIHFSGKSRIHLDTFLSVFNIAGIPDEWYRKDLGGQDDFIDGAVIAAARMLPTWSDRDIPPLPSLELSAVEELLEECNQMLAEFPTTLEKDQEILDSNPQASKAWESIIRYRMNKKLLIRKIIETLDAYQYLLLF